MLTSVRRRGRVLAPLVFAALVTASTGCGGGGRTQHLTAYFERAISLYGQSNVRVLGLPAGKVTSIKVVGTQVRVDMNISTDVPIPADVRAELIPSSLIGERYVQLFPAWTEGTPRARDGTVIPVERTSIPVEPDEALAALKRFLDALDPNSTGRLVKNLAADLRGNGQRLNDALGGLSQLVTTFADKDQQLLSIVDHFDRLTTTLRTREAQIGVVMDEFATTTDVLAKERLAIQHLVEGLGRVSSVGLGLVGEHGARLEHDIAVLARTLDSVRTNLDTVLQLVDSLPLLVAGPTYDGRYGLAGAYDAKYHHLDLRNSASPTVSQALGILGLPISPVCLPIDVACPASFRAGAAPTRPTVDPHPHPGVVGVGPASPAPLVSRSVGPIGTIAAPSGPRRVHLALVGWLARAARVVVEAL